MSERRTHKEDRRRVLKLLGGSAVLIPLASLHGCSGEKETASSMAPKADAPPAPKPAETAKPEPAPAAQTPPPAAGGDMPPLSEDDAQAVALGYKHDATETDTAKYPRYQAGQLCNNCALYQGDADAEWAGCTLFPGKAVNGLGWCSAYAPKT
jgi:hypothetical protein